MWRPQPGWQPQPSWEPQHGWDQPPITEVTPTTGDVEPIGPAASQYSPPSPASGYPPGGYPPAGYLMPGHPISEQAAPPARRSKRPWILGAAAAVLLLVLGGGGVAAFQVLNGGGTQPDQVVPADTIAFAKLDLNPSASEKIAAARLLHKIPKLGGFSGGSSDWRKAIFDALSANSSLPAGVDFDHDVKPWLGKRAAIAVRPTLRDGDPELLLVLQSTDDGKARTGISHFGSDNGVSFYKGYAVVAETQQIADQAIADAKVSTLSSSAQYGADMKQLGSLGVSSGWTDLGAVSRLVSKNSPLSAAITTGRVAYTVRLNSNSADLIGKVYGTFGGGVPANQPDLAGLPINTAVAAGVATSPATIDRSWQRYEDLLGTFALPSNDPNFPNDPNLTMPTPSEMIDNLEQQFGVRLPDDLKTLVGTGVTASVAADGLASGSPKFVVQSRTDGPAAVAVLDHLRHAMQEPGAPGFPLQFRSTSTGVILGNDPGYLASVGSSSGPKLSSLAAFKQSLPDRAGAQYTAFVNLDAVASSMRTGGASQDDLQTISAFSAAGLTLKIDGNTANLHVRLLAH